MSEKSLSLPTKPDPSKRYKNHAYFNADGTVNGEKLLALVNNTPGAFDLIMLEAMLRKHGSSTYAGIAGDLTRHLSAIILRAAYGLDEAAADELKAIDKLLHSGKYEIPLHKIREIVERYETSPPLARGWELRRLMSFLAAVVRPVRTDQPFSATQAIVVLDNVSAYELNLQQLAKEHWRQNSTLQSLAIRIYLQSLQEAGVDDREAITEQTLKRDLALVRQWEETHSETDKLKRGHYTGYPLSDGPITWCDFSEGWKTRRRNTKAKRGAKLLPK